MTDMDAVSNIPQFTSLYHTMILLTLLCLCISSRTSTLAIPTGHPPLSTAVHFQSILSKENTPSDNRTIWNIIFSCFSTLFACAWIAVHPNIPAPGDSGWKILRRRLMIMTFVLLTPEMVIIWAARQHRDTKVLTEKFQIEGRPGWTKAHAFFLIMGGFTLHANRRPLRVLAWDDLQTLAGAGRIAWPDITEEDIKDRSKGDYLSKGIVVFQTTWFIVQFFVRAVSKLTITELEVVTLAFSTLIGVIYYLWWDKPLDVRCSVPVHLVELNMGQTTSESNNIMDQDLPPNRLCSRCRLPLGVSPTMVEEEEIAEGFEIGPSNQRASVSLPPDSPSSPPHVQDKPHFKNRVKRLPLLMQTSCRERGTLPGLIYVFFILPTDSLLISQFHAMMDECTIETDLQERNGHAIDRLLRNGPLRVPTFYAYTGNSWDRIAFGAFISIIFGAMHCIAWYYGFSSSPERWGWRISSIIVSVMPLILLLIFAAFWWMGTTTRLSERSSPIFHVFHVGVAWPYIISRVLLLLFPLVALRALPPGAYAELDWVTMIPHI